MSRLGGVSRGQVKVVLAMLAVSLCAGGCAQFRGIPTHGGGKRFDEEQRTVAGAIRRTIAAMDLTELSGKRVLLQVTNLATSGSGTVDWPGPNSANINAGLNSQNYDTYRVSEDGISKESRDAPGLISGSVSYRLSGNYRSANVSTEGDMAYFMAVLDMKVRHRGIAVVNAKDKPDVVLNVLVDVLGTNRSRYDYLVATDDELVASCEVTYFAQNVSDGHLVFDARQTGARATYREKRVRLTSINTIERDTAYAKPMFYAVDGNGVAHTTADGVDLSSLPAGDLRARVQADPQAKEDVLESLYERARFHIESGNAAAAKDYLQEITEIDPGYSELGDLGRDLSRMSER